MTSEWVDTSWENAGLPVWRFLCVRLTSPFAPSLQDATRTATWLKKTIVISTLVFSWVIIYFNMLIFKTAIFIGFHPDVLPTREQGSRANVEINFTESSQVPKLSLSFKTLYFTTTLRIVIFGLIFPNNFPIYLDVCRISRHIACLGVLWECWEPVV